MDELLAQYETVIGLMNSDFTSHEFILMLAQRNQAAYVAALSQHVAGGEPFRALHAQLSRALNNHPALVQHTGNRASNDIFGNRGDCATWHRV